MKPVIKFLLLLCMMSINVKAQSERSALSTLNPKQKNLITISSYTAQGNLANLKTALNSGLDAGVTVNEIRESFVHLYAYCGFPRSLRGIMTFMEVIKERQAKGIKDRTGPEASPVKDNRGKYVREKTDARRINRNEGKGPEDRLCGFCSGN